MKEALRDWINKKRSRQVAAVYIGMTLVYAVTPIDFITRCVRGVGEAWSDTRESVAEVKEDLWTLVDEKSP